jgi:hypothetical protein
VAAIVVASLVGGSLSDFKRVANWDLGDPI